MGAGGAPDLEADDAGDGGWPRPSYPPLGPWRELTRAERRERVEVSADLLHALQSWRGEPRLTPWEEAFLTGMVRLLQAWGGTAAISRRQWDKVWQIGDKVAAWDLAGGDPAGGDPDDGPEPGCEG